MRAGDDEPLLAPGTIFAGRLRIERVVGRGGAGVVYEAQHLHLKQRVALKVLYGGAARDAESSARFIREAQMALSLTSPYVVRVHDLGVSDQGQPFIQMELLRGRGLDSVIAEQSALPIERAVRLVLQACIGVATAHAARLVHRDLKPENLFLATQPDGSEIVKVLDFGISKMNASAVHGGELTAAGASFGTPRYMAPEQCVSASEVDARCDQHALGLILYELLTRKPAFEGESAASITYQILHKKPPAARDVRADVPAGLDEAIEKSLAKQPRDRFCDVAELARAVAPFGGPGAIEDADAVARALHPGSNANLSAALALELPSSTTKRLRPMVWGLLTIVPIVAVAGLSLVLSHRPESDRLDSAADTQSAAPLTPAPVPVAADAAPTTVAAISLATAASEAPKVAIALTAAHPAPPSPAPPKTAPAAGTGHPAHQPIFHIPND